MLINFLVLFVFALPISALAAQTAQNAESRNTQSLLMQNWEYNCTMNLYLALNLAYLLEKLGSLKT
jgi:hypothetical protein